MQFLRWMTTFALVTALAALVASGRAAQDGKKPKPGDPKGDPKSDPKAGSKADAKLDYELSDEVKDVPALDLRALGNEHQRYFLIGAENDGKVVKKSGKAPKEGFALLVVMPGGPGDQKFTSFVRSIWKSCAPEGWLFAEMVSVKWKPEQQVIWPTRLSRVPGMEFTTEEYFAAVVEDVQKTQKLKLDPKRLFELGWSSSGPAEYAIALQEKSPIAGAYVAMSVFGLDELRPGLKYAKGLPFFLDHSPDDTTCKFSFAELARDTLAKEGATVELVTYKGGHGWNDDPFARLKKGFAWLDEQAAKNGKSGKPK